MPDLLNFLPIVGNNPILGPSRSSIFGDSQAPSGPQVWGGETDRMNIAGVPVAPLLGGLATAMIARSLAPRRSRGSAMRDGFMLGNSLFSRPIDEEKSRRDSLVRVMLDKGWLTPFGEQQAGAPQAGAPQAEGSPTAPPIAPGSGTPDGTPNGQAAPARTLRFGGVPLSLSPSVTLGDLLPGQSLPAGVAGARMPVTADLAQLAIQGAERKKLQDYLVGQGHSADMPTSLALEDYRIKHGVEMLPKYRDAMGPVDENTGVQFGIGPDGKPTIRAFTAPSSLTGLKRDELNARIGMTNTQAEIAKTNQEIQKTRLELERERLAELKNKSEQMDGAQLRTMLGLVTQDRMLLARTLEDIEKRRDALGNLSPEDIDARNRVIGDMDRLGEEVEMYRGAIAERTGLRFPKREGKVELTPEQKGEHDRITKYVTAFRTNPLGIGKYPEPKDEKELAAFTTAKQVFESQMKPVVDAIGEAMKNQPYWSSAPPREIADYLRSLHPEEYDAALRMWQAQKK